MDLDELKYWIAINRIPRIGRVRFKLLESHFGSLSDAWAAGTPELLAAGIDDQTAQLITVQRPTIDPDEEVSKLERLGARAVTWNDTDYPSFLKEIDDLPPVLYYRGDLRPEDERSVAVVGTRKATAYGRQVAQRLTYDLAQAGVTIVSGLAHGVDGIAHRAALEAGNRTIAVVASGLDSTYPSEHTNLAAQIVESGAVVTEYPLGTRPKAEHFPRRNRIMSGMTLGTVVIEAAEHSGALITARHALEQNREVFAVPGSVMSASSRGTNQLIKRAEAKLVSEYEDILEELNITQVGQQIEMKALFPADDNETKILSHLTQEPLHIDEVIRNAGIGISEVSGALALMELRGLVRQIGGMNYIRTKESYAAYEAAV